MREDIRILELDQYDYGIIIKALNCYRNEMLQAQKEDEQVVIAELMERIMDTPSKKKNIDKKFEER